MKITKTMILWLGFIFLGIFAFLLSGAINFILTIPIDSIIKIIVMCSTIVVFCLIFMSWLNEINSRVDASRKDGWIKE